MTDIVAKPRKRRWPWIASGIVIVAIVAIVALWDWDWFLPMVDSQASAALGRQVAAKHLHVSLGRTTTVSLDGVQIAGVDGIAGGKPFATATKLTVVADVMAYIRSREIVLPQIILDHPVIEAEQDADGKANWPAPKSSASDKPADPKAGPKIGQLVIDDGSAHVKLARLKADFTLDIATRQGTPPEATTPTGTAAPASAPGATAAQGGAEPQHAADAKQGPASGSDTRSGEIVVKARGTYAAQPIEGQFIGGALLSLRDTANPYPVDLHLANGATKVALTGTVQNPLNFAGANLTLRLSGADMSKLTPLTGVPIPQTPAYDIAGHLDYADKKVRFTDFKGRLGNSDLNGSIAVDPTRQRPFVDATLFSRRVDLTDLGGFIGAAPGHKGEAESPREKAALAHKEASDQLFPDTPINLPKLNAADVSLRYKGARIEGRFIPLDNIEAAIDIRDGHIDVHPLSFAVGTGQISTDIKLAPAGKALRGDFAVDFHHVDLARLLAATHLVKGAGAMSGSAKLVSEGSSLASLLANGSGGVKLGMSGGNLSALLVDVAGLEFGQALLSALGIPQRANLQCFALDMPLDHGIMHAQAFILDTSEARVQGAGSIDLRNETLDMKLKTASKHFSVGSLPTPIDITGHLKSPSIKPEIGPLAVRGGAAVGLGVLFPPLALLPTIQFGTGEDFKCQASEGPIARSTPASIGTTEAVHHPVRHAPRRARRR